MTIITVDITEIPDLAVDLPVVGGESVDLTVVPDLTIEIEDT